MDETREMMWKSLEAKIGGEQGEELVSAMKELYSLFDEGVYEWMASLYEPELGGWYYARSAQVTDGYLPDAESTYYALGSFFESMRSTGGVPYEEIIPDSLRKKVGSFFYNLQDPDGYFYHPQWGKDISHIKASRDLGTCSRMINRLLGIPTKYPLPGKLESAGREYDINNAPERFRSVSRYKKYLREELDFVSDSYHAGHEMSAQMSEVESFGKKLGEDFVGITLDYISSLERADNGLWDAKKNYHGANGIHKISRIYNWYGRKMPYAKRALESIMEIIMSDEPVTANVDAYNPWHVIGELVKNLRNCHRLPEGEMKEIIAKIRAFAPRAVRKSTEKMRVFKKPDGGMSMEVNTSRPYDQGCLAAVPGTVEGDVNGMTCVAAIIPSIYSAIDLEDFQVPLYTPEDYRRYIGLVMEREAEYQRAKNN